VPDLRGHGQSEKPRGGYHVARLALDLQNLIEELKLPSGQIKAIGTSLGAAIIWSYSELFTSHAFSHVVYVDQAPLQNYLPDWGVEFGNRGCNSPDALAAMQRSLESDARTAHLGTINACLGYRWAPRPDDAVQVGSQQWEEDEAFFLGEALKGHGRWYGKLMADHTALDWRDAISQAFGRGSGSTTKTLVVASTRSGCFPAKGPLKVVELVNGDGEEEEGLARGVVVEWGGHWCYWEEPGRFNELVLGFLGE
jgi:pimeloyl-ACP methyl ester carboxylesterase